MPAAVRQLGGTLGTLVRLHVWQILQPWKHWTTSYAAITLRHFEVEQQQKRQQQACQQSCATNLSNCMLKQSSRRSGAAAATAAASALGTPVMLCAWQI
jgi:hypothetical protein